MLKLLCWITHARVSTDYDQPNWSWLAWRWQLFEPVCPHHVSYRCGDLIQHGGSVCSLHDPWPPALRLGPACPNQSRDETSGCPAKCLWSRLKTHLAAPQFRFCLLFCLETWKTNREIETNAQQEDRKERNWTLRLSHSVLRKEPYYLPWFLSVGSFPLHLRAGTCLIWGSAC